MVLKQKIRGILQKQIQKQIQVLKTIELSEIKHKILQKVKENKKQFIIVQIIFSIVLNFLSLKLYLSKKEYQVNLEKNKSYAVFNTSLNSTETEVSSEVNKQIIKKRDVGKKKLSHSPNWLKSHKEVQNYEKERKQEKNARTNELDKPHLTINEIIKEKFVVLCKIGDCMIKTESGKEIKNGDKLGEYIIGEITASSIIISQSATNRSFKINF